MIFIEDGGTEFRLAPEMRDTLPRLVMYSTWLAWLGPPCHRSEGEADVIWGVEL